MPCKKAKKSGGKKKKPCISRAEDSNFNAELFGGGIKTVSCQLKRSKMVILPKARTQLKTKNVIPAFLSAAKRNFFMVTPPLSR